MKLIYLITVIFIFLFSQRVFAQECSTSENKLAVYFSNGMSNNKDDAKNSLESLKNATQSQLTNYSVHYDIAYNDNETWYYQLAEVFVQRQVEEWSLFWRYLSAIDIAPDWFQDEMKEIAVSLDSTAYVDDTDLQSHISKYKQEIENCNRLLIVAHSQGNFYANQAWDSIYNSKIKSDKYTMKNFPNIGLLSVATPAGHVGEWLLNAGDHQPITSYVTLSNDWIVNSVRALGYMVLTSNQTNTNEDDDWKHHGFVESYLSGNNSSPAIIQAISNISPKLEVLPFDRIAVVSSSLKSVGYLAKSNMLEVEFVSKGSIYRYYDVPQQIYDALMSADSHGSYFYANIRTSFTYKKVYEGA